MASKFESVMILSGFSPSAGATQMIFFELSGFSTYIMLAIGAPLICLLCSSPSSTVASSRVALSELLLCTPAVLSLGLPCCTLGLHKGILSKLLLCTPAVLSLGLPYYYCCVSYLLYIITLVVIHNSMVMRTRWTATCVCMHAHA